MTRNRKTYPGNLTEAQAELLLPLIPPAKEGGRPRCVDMLSVLNPVLYVLCTGSDRGTSPLKALSTKVLRLLSYKQIHRFQLKS